MLSGSVLSVVYCSGCSDEEQPEQQIISTLSIYFYLLKEQALTKTTSDTPRLERTKLATRFFNKQNNGLFDWKKISTEVNLGNDGKKVGSTQGTQMWQHQDGIGNTNGSTRFADGTSGTRKGLIGGVDEVQIYNDALSATQVQQLANGSFL